uniref:Putative ovule protein n=1 Tax=Solanum chacoense TaxID=4108 RepID=A0A0V0H9T3_SOLCH
MNDYVACIRPLRGRVRLVTTWGCSRVVTKTLSISIFPTGLLFITTHQSALSLRNGYKGVIHLFSMLCNNKRIITLYFLLCLTSIILC